MQTKMPRPAEKSKQSQAVHSSPQLLAEPQAIFEDHREQSTQLKTAKANMAASPQQQNLQVLQAKMNAGSGVQQLKAQQTHFNQLLQPNAPQAIQRREDEEPLQGKFETYAEPTAQLAEAATPTVKPNNTGLPDNLKSGIENLSGISMDHVKVHYNSAKPAQLQAHAYAQGSDIHVAPGQEQHLPHEAWHVVQQAQGRVKPTLQMKGDVQVNDDVSLEAEADVMGMMSYSQPQIGSAPIVPRQTTTATPNVIQGYFETHESQYQSEEDIKQNRTLFLPKSKEAVFGASISEEIFKTLVAWATDNEDWGSNWSEESVVEHLYEQIKNRISEDPDYEINTEGDPREYFDNLIGKNSELAYTNWIPAMNNMEYYVANLRQVLDDDSDIAVVNDYMAKLYEFKKQMMDLKTTLNSAKPTDYDLTIQIKSFLAQTSSKIINLFNELKKVFPLHSGGFSAKGRAHDMETSSMDLDGYTADNSYLKNTTLDGAALMPSSINKKHLNVMETAADITMPAELKQIINTKGLDAGLKVYENILGATVETPQPETYSNTPVSKDRDGGQAVNMLNVSATAYAMMSNVPNWQSKKWEWLHVRAASLGGATNGTNLVVGTRDANTHMMPFESNVRTLASLVGENDNYDELKVSFAVNNQYGVAKHRFNEILIKWTIKKSETASMGTRDLNGEAKFSPLSTASSISKDEVKIIEDALKDKRDGLKEQDF